MYTEVKLSVMELKVISSTLVLSRFRFSLNYSIFRDMEKAINILCKN